MAGFQAPPDNEPTCELKTARILDPPQASSYAATSKLCAAHHFRRASRGCTRDREWYHFSPEDLHALHTQEHR